MLRNINTIAEHFNLPAITKQRLLDVIGYNSNDFWEAVLGENKQEYLDFYTRECMPTEIDYMYPTDGARECIAELKAMGLRVGCASNRLYPSVIVERMNLQDDMECVCGACDVEHPKPAPDMLFHAAKLLGVTSEESVYVGDTPIDVLAARNAHMCSITVPTSNSPEKLKEAGSDYIVNSLIELPGLLKNNNLIA